MLGQPGHADDAVTLPLGYGRSGLHETTAQGVGFNAYPLRSADAPWFDGGADADQDRAQTYKLASTQEHWTHRGPPHRAGHTLDEWKHQVRALTSASALARTQGERGHAGHRGAT